MQLIRVLPLAALLVMAAAAAETQLEMVSATIDQQAHHVDVALVNHSAKTAVAYVLEVHQFDAAGKPVGEPQYPVGFDWAGMLAWGDRTDPHFILPGAEGTVSFGLLPDAVNASADVLAVVYKDRTAEGNQKEIATAFDSRRRHAEQAQSAADLLATYPASKAEAEERFEKLAAIPGRSGAADELLKTKTLDRAQWSAAAAEQKRFADGLSALAKEATQ
jgi:hypothetical protein